MKKQGPEKRANAREFSGYAAEVHSPTTEEAQEAHRPATSDHPQAAHAV